MTNYKDLAYNVYNELSNKVQSVTELEPYFEGRKSYYKKAHVITLENGARLLRSYNTIVALITSDGRFIKDDNYSATTGRHQHEFYNQFALIGSDENDNLVTYNIESVLHNTTPDYYKLFN